MWNIKKSLKRGIISIWRNYNSSPSDGNCFYRAVALNLTNNEPNYKTKREFIYNVTNENKENIKPFFKSNQW